MERLQELVTRSFRVICLGLFATVVFTALGAGASPAGGPLPATVISFPGVARSFAAAAGRVAWIDTAWVLHVRSVRSGVETTIRYTNPYEEIPSFSAGPPLVLEPRQLLWLSTRGTGSLEDADHVYVASVGATHGRRVANTVHGERVDGGYVAGLAGDSAGFAYGIVTVKAVPAAEHRYQVSGGGVWTLTGATPRQLPGAPPAIVLAESAGRVAIAPVDNGERQEGTPLAAGTVEIRNATTGAVVSSVTPTGAVRAAALTPTTLAVLAGGRIARYDAATGKLLGTTPAPADTAAELDAAGMQLAFRRTRSVDVVDLTSGRISKLVPTSWRPAGVALDGLTLAWVEQRRIAPGNVSKKTYTTRIRTLALQRGEPAAGARCRGTARDLP